ncbi:MAG: orotate phosphoribosyltransferase [Sphingobacteriia bacterium]|jgi:orotate phosphoribosyltransferase
MTIAQQVANYLLRIHAFKFNPTSPYTWTSGWHSPVYCDNRQTLGYPEIRSAICEGLVNLAKTHFSGLGAVAGVATAGIAQGALVADRLALPYAYVRSSPKAHGLGNQIEGFLPPGAPVLVVEDLVSTGKSSLNAIEALRTAGHTVAGLVCIFSYGFPAAAGLFAQHAVEWYSLTNLEALIEAGIQQGQLPGAMVETIRNWQQAPELWQAATS